MSSGLVDNIIRGTRYCWSAGCTLVRDTARHGAHHWSVDLPALLDDLHHMPRLPGARCRGRSGLFDRTVPGVASRTEAARARREALRLCRDCPALRACGDWLDSLEPPHRPRGVIAGRSNAWLERRPAGVPAGRTRWYSA